MAILFLGPADSRVWEFLQSQSEPAVRTDEPLSLSELQCRKPSFVVSHGFRHIVGTPVLRQLGPAIINLHISLLPWNRGADPNLWSFLEDSPAGVSIHQMDEGIDTGPVLLQRELLFADTETLRTSYEALQAAIAALFVEHWSALRARALCPHVQPSGGSVHRLRDKEPYLPLLATKGWDTLVGTLRGKARQRATA
jgi:methionyl-tRNA formyltransferase